MVINHANSLDYNGPIFLPLLYIGRFFTGVGVGWTNRAIMLQSCHRVLSEVCLWGYLRDVIVLIALGILI